MLNVEHRSFDKTTSSFKIQYSVFDIPVLHFCTFAAWL